MTKQELLQKLAEYFDIEKPKTSGNGCTDYNSISCRDDWTRGIVLEGYDGEKRAFTLESFAEIIAPRLGLIERGGTLAEWREDFEPFETVLDFYGGDLTAWEMRDGSTYAQIEKDGLSYVMDSYRPDEMRIYKNSKKTGSLSLDDAKKLEDEDPLFIFGTLFETIAQRVKKPISTTYKGFTITSIEDHGDTYYTSEGFVELYITDLVFFLDHKDLPVPIAKALFMLDRDLCAGDDAEIMDKFRNAVAYFETFLNSEKERIERLTGLYDALLTFRSWDEILRGEYWEEDPVRSAALIVTLNEVYELGLDVH